MTSSHQEIRALTGLRGVLALWVVLLHITVGMDAAGYAVGDRLPAALVNVFNTGPLAVDGFFVLSGFVLSYTYAADVLARRVTWMRFLLLRLARIYPVHLAMLAAFALVLMSPLRLDLNICGNPANRTLAVCDRFSLHELLRHLTLTASWDLDHHVGWNIAAWSISSEWFAYLGFPLFAAAAIALSPWVAALTVPLVLAAMVAVLMWCAPFHHGVADDYSLLRVVPEFFAGCLLHRVTGLIGFHRLPWSMIAGAAVIVTGIVVSTAVAPMMAVGCLTLLILALASGQRGLVDHVLTLRPVQWLGRISYPLYMVNQWVIEVVGALGRSNLKHTLKTPSRMLLSYLALTLLCVVAAWLIHRWIEEPARRAVRRRLALSAREPQVAG